MNGKEHKTERRRSSIFSLLKSKKKLSRQISEPPAYNGLPLNRKYSVDSAILSGYDRNGLDKFLSRMRSAESVVSTNSELCNGG